MKLENKNKIIGYIGAGVFSIIAIIISKLFIQPHIFNVDSISDSKVHLGLEIIFIFLAFIGCNFIINFVKRLIFKEKLYKVWIINFFIYLGIMMAFLLIMWPGHWVWDEFFVVQEAINSKVYTWQSYLTIIYYSLCFMIIPSPVGIVIIQQIIISFIVSYIIAKIYIKFNSKIVNIILYMIFLTPAVIINNLYPLRLTLYGYILLLEFSILLFDKIEGQKLNLLKILKQYLLVVIILLWRSEGIIYAFIMLVLMYITYNKNGLRKIAVILLIITNLVIIKSYNKIINVIGNGVEAEIDKYGLTIYISPLSEMLQYDLKGKNIDKYIADVDKVLNIETMRKYPSYIEIPSFWKTGDEAVVKENFREYLPEFKKAYIKIVINNLDLFIKYRTKTFLSTCGMDAGSAGISTGNIIDYFTDPDYTSSNENAVVEFLTGYKGTNVINEKIKVIVESELVGKNHRTREYNRFFLVFFWNVLPILVLIAILAVINIIKRNWIFVFIYIAQFGNAFIVYLTAPANYFMYYFPVYLIGLVFAVLNISYLIYNKNNLLNENNQ